MAPAEMPRVIPPMPKYSTINMTLKSPVDIPNEFAIPDNTPPSILSFMFLYILPFLPFNLLYFLYKMPYFK